MAFPLILLVRLRLFGWREYWKEVWEVVKAMNGDKALSLDGYSMAFFQACWDVLKEDIMKVFHHFHARGKFKRSLNSTLITLIPRILGLLMPNTFARLVL